jgi:K+-transporting ATPase ATPase A chain
MTSSLQYVFGFGLIALIAGLSWFLGRYMAWAVEDSAGAGIRARVDGWLSRLTGVDAGVDQGFRGYAVALLTFSLALMVLFFLILLGQGHMPVNPDAKIGLEPTQALHTAASIMTNTQQQHYSGEASLSYLSQLMIVILDFTSPATAMAVLVAIGRRMGGRPLGNFWRDLTRIMLLILLPLALSWACLLLLTGSPMTFHGSVVAQTLEGAEQVIARGPVAAFTGIKQLGTNGGGFFGPNSTHPFENPSFVSNALESIAILLIPMASVWMFGRLVGRLRHAAVVFGVMLTLLVVMMGWGMFHESAPSVAVADAAVQVGPNLEGKELRFGAGTSAWWGVATTATGNGSVNSMHNSFNSLTGVSCLFGMWTNSVFGGCGAGVINLFLFMIVATVLAGMMVGRTPEYLGRKVEAREMKLAVIGLVVPTALILGGSALFAATSWGAGTVANAGSRGFTEIIYEVSSAVANNGSGYEGLGDNTPAWNLGMTACILLGRFVPLLAPLGIAATLGARRPSPETAGTFRVDTATFGVMLIAVVIVVTGLLFLPAAILGPIAEQLAMSR